MYEIWLDKIRQFVYFILYKWLMSWDSLPYGHCLLNTCYSWVSGYCNKQEIHIMHITSPQRIIRVTRFWMSGGSNLRSLSCGLITAQQTNTGMHDVGGTFYLEENPGAY